VLVRVHDDRVGARDRLERGEVDAVDVIASRFVNTLTQQPMTLPLLPIRDITELQIPGVTARDSDAPPIDFLFEPDAADIISYAIDIYVKVFIHVVLLNAKASEQSARMVSMQNATDSARDMIRRLTLEYNTRRQGRITQELLEIAGGTSS
jgi:F-type H+-transporting ATPase subunit gamma